MNGLKKNLHYTEKRRSRSLDATSKGPWIKLWIAIAAVTLALLALVFVIIPAVNGRLQISLRLPQRTASATAAPESTPLAPAILTSRVQSFVPDAENGEAAVTDFALMDGALLYAAGDTETACDVLVRYDLVSGKRRVIRPQILNDGLRMPRMNADYLVWFDAKAGGGGSICVRTLKTNADAALIELSRGVPELYLSGQYLVFKADADGAAKLYAVNLATFEPVTLALLDEGETATSAPAIADGRVYYAIESGIGLADLSSGQRTETKTETPAHDPEPVYGGLLWLSAHHGEDTDLYFRSEAGDTLCLARGVIDAAAANQIAAYGRDGTVYAYSFLTERFYMLSGAEDYAQLVAAGGDYVFWRVLTSAGTLYHYLKVN